MYGTGLIQHEGEVYGPNGLQEVGKSKILDCGHPRPEWDGKAFTVPWAIVQTAEGPAEYCLDCVAALEAEALRVLPKGAGYTAYFKLANPPKGWRSVGGVWCGRNSGNEITTWHGTKLMDIVEYNVWWHNFGGRFVSISAVDIHGNRWHGRASYNWECINLYKNKVQPND